MRTPAWRSSNTGVIPSSSDQVLGRAAAGSDQNDASFRTLPPHFDDLDGPALSLEESECILPGYSRKRQR